jgi:hypothetical protein
MCVCSEENDVDAKFNQPLWSHVPTFERQVSASVASCACKLQRTLQLVIDKIDLALAKGDDTTPLEQQLMKLEQRHEQMNKAAKRTYSPYAKPTTD